MELEKNKEGEELEVVANPEDNSANEGEPHGAFLFVILMIVGYIGYWSLIWYEVFVGR